MKPPPLKPAEMDMVRAVFRLHPEIETVTLFGSRAKGAHCDRSDVDLVVTGDVAPLRAESIAAELDELPLPYHFEVQPLEHISHRPLLDHIRRVGIQIYPVK
jgi:predicted nucleotidyltransferase